MKTQLHYLLLTAVLGLFSINILNAQTPPIAGNWEEIPELTDEFNSGINTSNWNNYDPAWDGRFPSYFERSNVSVQNGKLKLKCRKVNSNDNPPYSEKGSYSYATAAYKSTHSVLYGYFETKSKTVGSGYWNSFWMYDSSVYAYTEIDIYEIVAGEDYRFSTAHMFYRQNPYYQGTTDNHIKKQKEFYNVANLNSYHTYGFNWTVNTLTWYVDDVEVFSTPNTNWFYPLYVMFDAEVNPKWPALPGNTQETYEIEYVRTWKNNEIIAVNAPSTVKKGETITFSVDYEAASNKTITCAFQKSTYPWSTYVTTTANVQAGVGSVNITMTIPSSTPTGNNYKFQTLIGDGSWDGKNDNLEKWSIAVTN